MSATTMPAAFIGHGSPMNALEQNRYTESWRRFGASLPRPRAVLVVSAHWFINATAVTAMPRPRVIHDFFGFPEELFAFDYPAPGAPQIAEEIAEVVKPAWVGLDHDSWGIDHGTWSILAHVFPQADIPVLQLSVHGAEPAAYHLDLGRRLAPLREDGVCIIASGNLVHNLRLVDGSRPDGGFDWALRFDDAARQQLLERPGDADWLSAHGDYLLAAPTPDHFYPLLYLAGLAAASSSAPEVLVDGYQYGSLSMTSFTLGAAGGGATGAAGSGGAPGAAATEGAAPLPDPGAVPPDETNA
ncbi:MAG TPA: 4,5-DOPA dioxygenase extradiol [Acidimicrobiales bacterium]|nr:4,5-DOPA dioxygenase extradiol [Acidimicrobiales bacterium]